MGTQTQCFEQNKKIFIIFHLKINIFTAMKYCRILHGRVYVMVSLNILKGKHHLLIIPLLLLYGSDIGPTGLKIRLVQGLTH